MLTTNKVTLPDREQKNPCYCHVVMTFFDLLSKLLSRAETGTNQSDFSLGYPAMKINIADIKGYSSKLENSKANETRHFRPRY